MCGSGVALLQLASVGYGGLGRHRENDGRTRDRTPPLGQEPHTERQGSYGSRSDSVRMKNKPVYSRYLDASQK